MDNPITAALQSLKGIVGQAAQPEHREAGPGDVGPTTETKMGGLVTLEMTAEEVQQWFTRVEAARQRIKNREEAWDMLLKEYLPILKASGEAETVRTAMHFRNVHTKIGQMFYRSPDLILTPDDPSPAQNEMPNPMNAKLPPDKQLPPLKLEDIVAVKQAVLTKKMGRDGIKGDRLMDELLFDVLAWAGIGCAKVGYRCVSKQIPVTPQPGAVLGLGAAPAQAQQTEPVPIFEEWYLRRFSPKKLLVNDDLRSTRFDEDATFMGFDFYMSPKRAMNVFKLTEEEASKAAEDDRIHKYDEDTLAGGGAGRGLVHGIELWVKAAYFTDDQPHPQALNQLVLIEGLQDRPVVWRPSPDQTFDPQTGRLTEDSLIGFPIRVLTLRDLADSPFTPSDSAFTNGEIKQLNTWRRQSIQIRDAAIGKYFYDSDAFDENEIALLKEGEVGAYIGVSGGKLAQGAEKVFTTTAQIHQTQDDFRAQQVFKQDINETLGISGVQAGTGEDTVRSATEIATVQTAVQGRNGKELNRAVDFYLDCARMVDQLLMRYATNDEYVRLTGTNGAQRIQMWNNQLISGRYLYDIAPDSQMAPDSEADFRMDKEMYNLAAKDPLFNRGYWLKRMARRRGADPARATIDESQLPKPEPEKPKMTITVGAADLIAPSPLLLLLLQQAGIQIQLPQTPGEVPPGGVQPPHGGPAAKAETISQHTASNSGNRPNEPGAVDHRADQAK